MGIGGAGLAVPSLSGTLRWALMVLVWLYHHYQAHRGEHWWRWFGCTITIRHTEVGIDGAGLAVPSLSGTLRWALMALVWLYHHYQAHRGGH